MLVCVSGPGSRLYTSAAPEPEVFDFYIGPSGSDSNDGLTTETPWAITALNTKRASYAGNSVGILDGTYDVSEFDSYDTEDGNTAIFGIASGTTESPTLIKSVNPRGAILNAKNGSDVRSTHPIMGTTFTSVGGNVGGTGNTIIDGIHFTGAKYSMLWWYSGTTSSWGGSGLIIRNCDFSDQYYEEPDNAPAIMITGCDAPLIQNCRFRDIDVNGTGGGAVGVQLYSCRRSVIEKCTGYNIDRLVDDKHANSGGGRLESTIVRYCHTYSTRNPTLFGFDNWQGDTDDAPFEAYEIYGNLFRIGANEALESHSGGVVGQSSTKIHGNTIIVAGTPAAIIARVVADEAMACDFYNNLIHRASGSAPGDGDYAISEGAIGVQDYNGYPTSFNVCIITPINDPGGTFVDHTTLSAIRTATGQEAGSNTGTPTFTGSGDLATDYQLQVGSFGRDMGRVGGLSGGASRHIGCWDGVVTQVGCDFEGE